MFYRGAEEVRARLFLLTIELIKEDLPTLDFPARTISGVLPFGYWDLFITDISNFALFIFMIITFSFNYCVLILSYSVNQFNYVMFFKLYRGINCRKNGFRTFSMLCSTLSSKYSIHPLIPCFAKLRKCIRADIFADNNTPILL